MREVFVALPSDIFLEGRRGCKTSIDQYKGPSFCSSSDLPLHRWAAATKTHLPVDS
jgi:hypothetical protein